MIGELLASLPLSVLSYLIEFSFVYSIIFERYGLSFLSALSYDMFTCIVEVYAKKLVN
jgi:hypothetical protein